MSEKRKKYTASEKAKIALEVIKSGLTLAQINAWKKQAVALLVDVFRDKNKTELIEHEKQFATLYEQIGRLKVENGAITTRNLIRHRKFDLGQN